MKLKQNHYKMTNERKQASAKQYKQILRLSKKVIDRTLKQIYYS